jgi:hypothetical protein
MTVFWNVAPSTVAGTKLRVSPTSLARGQKENKRKDITDVRTETASYKVLSLVNNATSIKYMLPYLLPLCSPKLLLLTDVERTDSPRLMYVWCPLLYVWSMFGPCEKFLTVFELENNCHEVASPGSLSDNPTRTASKNKSPPLVRSWASRYWRGSGDVRCAYIQTSAIKLTRFQ